MDPKWFGILTTKIKIRSGRVISYKVQFTKKNFILTSLKYNQRGLLIEEKIQGPEGTGIIEYEYDNQGNIILARMKEEK